MICQVKYKNKIKGFTLIELLIVISITAIFSSISVTAYKKINEKNIFNGVVNTIIQSIRYTKNKSLNQNLNTNWGVYIENDKVTVFSGDDYSSRNSSVDEVFDLPRGVIISGLTEIVFDKITGKIASEGDIVISRGDENKTIHVNYYGVIFYDENSGETNICQDVNAINYGGVLPCQYEGVYPSGTISSSPENCLITSGNNSCSTALSWNTTNPIDTSIVSKSGSTIATGNSGSQSVSVSYGTNIFNLINNGTTLNSVSILGSCDTGLSWNGSACVYPSGNISASSTSCIIASGNNSCSTALSWDTTNPIDTSIVSKSGSTIATGNSGSQSVSISYGTNTFNLINNGTTLSSVSVSGVCISGTSWNDSSCVPSPSGSISSSPENCLITSGNNSCSSTLSWNTTNPIDTSIVSKSGSTIATGNSGSQSVSVSYGTNIFNLINNGTTLNSVSVLGSCDTGLSWSGSVCEEDIFVPTFNYSLDMNNDWGSGYCTNITITTDSPDPVVWEVDIPLTTYPQNGTPSSTWNITWSFNNQILTVSGIAEWNFYVSSGSPNTSGGFCANR